MPWDYFVRGHLPGIPPWCLGDGFSGHQALGPPLCLLTLMCGTQDGVLAETNRPG